jgi:hypothetical protein
MSHTTLHMRRLCLFHGRTACCFRDQVATTASPRLAVACRSHSILVLTPSDRAPILGVGRKRLHWAHTTAQRNHYVRGRPVSSGVSFSLSVAQPGMPAIRMGCAVEIAPLTRNASVRNHHRLTRMNICRARMMMSNTVSRSIVMFFLLFACSQPKWLYLTPQ